MPQTSMRLSLRRKKSSTTTVGKSSKKPAKKEKKKKTDSFAAAHPSTPPKRDGVLVELSPSRRKKIPPSRRGSTRVRSKEFQSPLAAIEESFTDDELRTMGTVLTSPNSTVLTSLSVVSLHTGEDGHQSTEVIYGHITPNTKKRNDTVRKKLFDEEDVIETLPPEEEPFDVVKPIIEDPTIIDIMKMERKKEEEKVRASKSNEEEESKFMDKALGNREEQKTEEEEQKEETAAATENPYGKEQKGGQDATGVNPSTEATYGPNKVTEQLMEAFNCTEDTTHTPNKKSAKANGGKNVALEDFYDAMCAPLKDKPKKATYFGEELTKDFVKEASVVGFPLLHHIPPKASKDKASGGWTGRSGNLHIKFGHRRGSQLVQPRLLWSTPGGWSREGNDDVLSIAIELFDIVAILDSVEELERRDDDDNDIAAAAREEDLCCFSITTSRGDVYLFEAITVEEKELVVSGIKSVIARLSFNVVAGNASVTGELFRDEVTDSGELPSLRRPKQHINDVAHAFLDSAFASKQG